MLPAANRLTHAAGFGRAVRGGRRAGSRTLVVHGVGPEGASPSGSEAESARVGFVVSRAVGNAVVRNRVRRRLRHLTRDRLERLSAGTLLVVRALPASAAATYDDLGRDLDRSLERVLRSTAEADRS